MECFTTAVSVEHFYNWPYSDDLGLINAERSESESYEGARSRAHLSGKGLHAGNHKGTSHYCFPFLEKLIYSYPASFWNQDQRSRLGHISISGRTPSFIATRENFTPVGETGRWESALCCVH